MKHFICSLISIFYFSTISLAQQKTNGTEKREMFYRIASVKKINNDSVIALLTGGKNLGVEIGSIGIVKGVYKSEDDRSDLELGFASVYKVTDTSAFITIRPTDKTGTKKDYEIRSGDYVKLKINVPKLGYRSIFFELGLLDIQFDNLDGDALYDITGLFSRDGKILEDSLLKVGAKDVFKTYDVLKDDEGFLKLKEPLAEGRYQGRSIFDVMKECTAKDVFGFLHFVNNYPGKYIGHTWKLNETFATWVMNKAPYSQKEMLDSILANKNNPTKLKAFISKNLALFKKEKFVNNWTDDANTEAEKGNYEEATKLFDAVKLVLPYLQDDCITGYYFYNYIAVFESKKQYEKVYPLLDSAYYYFSKCGNDYYKAQSLLQKGLAYNQQGKSDQSLIEFEKVLVEINKGDSKLSAAQKQSFLARYHHLSGVIQAVKGELKKAVNHYENAIKNYTEMNSFSSLQAAITVQGRLARLYKRQGELVKSLEIYNEQLDLYTKINDKKNIAEVLNNIGEIYFDQANYRPAIQYYSNAQSIYFSFEDFNNVGLSESFIAQSYYSLGKYDSAIDGHNKAIAYRQQSGSKTGLAFSWKKLATLYSNNGEKEKSLAAYDSAAYYYTVTNDSSRLRDLLSDIGDVYYNDKQYQKAFQTYFKWHQLNVANKSKPDIANSAYQLGWSAFSQNIDTSRFYFLQCLNTAKEIGDKSNQLYANVGLGSIFYKAFDYEPGEKYFNAALQLAIEEKNKKQEANVYKLIGTAYTSKLEFDKAHTYYSNAIKIYDSLGDKSALPPLYNNIGNNYQSKGDFEESKKWYQKSIEEARKINNRSDVGFGYAALTFLYILQGELDKAQQSVDTTYAIFKDLNNSWQMATAYFNRALVYEAKSDGINAIKYYKMADSIYKDEKDIFSRSNCYNNMGAVFFYQADYKNALKYFIETDQFLSSIKTTTEAHILSQINIGESYFYLKDYVKAEKYLKEGYQMAVAKKAGRMQTISASFLGSLYYELKNYPLSEKYLLEGFALAEKSNESDLYLNTGMYLGKLYAAINQLEKGAFYFNKTYQYSKKIQNSKYIWMALYEQGIYFYNQQKYDSAAKFFIEAVGFVENASQNLFGGAEAKKIYSADERKVDLYNKLVAALAKLGKKEDALYYAEKSNIQALKEQADKAGLVINDKAKSEALQKGNDLLTKKNAVELAISKEKTKPENEQNKQLIASLESVQSVAVNDYTNYIEGLQIKYPDLQSYFANTNPKDFRNYIDDIPDSTIVVLYLINDNQLLIFTVTNKETGLKTVDLKQDLNKQAGRFLAILRNPNNATGTGGVTLRSTIKPVDDIRGDFKSEAASLYNLLITPIEEQLKDKKNICFIPNGKLSSIPFQSIGYADGKNNFHFLLENFNIFYTSKIDIFRKNFKKRPMQSSLAIFGNPDKSLPGATLEANEIGKLIKGSVVFTEDKATEEKAKESLSTYNYIHFATHGVLDYEQIQNSYLLFAPGAGEGNQGKLTIAEVNGLTKPTSSLVVLSACETAVSKEEVKGFYISPANSFLTNRVDAVIGSLWKVPDETTNLLLQEFYKNLELKGMGKAEALRVAQATVSSDPKYSHPFYWSAFVLYGEWR